MKKSIYTFIIIILILPFLIQCASQTDVDAISYQLRIVNKKLEDMKSNQVGQLQKRQAAASGQMDQLENELLNVKSQLEETYYLNQRLREQNKELENSISNIAQAEATKREEALRRFEELQKEKETQLAELNKKIIRQQKNVQAIQRARLKDAERRSREAAITAKLAKNKARSVSRSLRSGTNSKHIHVKKKKIKNKPNKKNNPTTTTTPPSTTVDNPASNSTMAKAQRLYDKHQFSKALTLFKQIADNPTATNSVDARYMMGECFFQKKAYDKAIMHYQKIISQHPGSSKAPAAMLSQGKAFQKLADKETARVIYRKLLKKHGNSPEAAIAAKKLEKLD